MTHKEFKAKLALEDLKRVAIRQCLRRHPRVYDGSGICDKCKETN